MPIAPFQLERFFARHEFQAPYLLCTSDCQSMRLGELLALEPGADEAFHEVWLGYTESPGSPGLRQAIAELYDGLKPDRTLVHTGAEEAIFGFCQSLLGPGDEVLTMTPCYQSLFEAPHHAGATVKTWPARRENAWLPDLDELRALLSPRTRAVFVNFPHNPTGVLAPRDWFVELCSLADQHGFLLFSDEVYRFLEHDPAKRPPSACELTDRAVCLGVMSKSFGLAGLRIGWVASHDEAALAAMAGFKDYTTICNSAPSEFLAELALRNKESILRRNHELTLRNKALLTEFIERRSERFAWRPGQGGPIAFPWLADGSNVEDFCRDMVERHGVLLAPASLFLSNSPCFRVGYGREDFPQALAKLDEALG